MSHRHPFGCVVLFVAISYFLGMPLASANDLRSEHEKCVDNFIDNMSWAKCGAEEISRQEKLLTTAWNKISHSVKTFDIATGTGGQNFKILLNEQRQWIKWKDSSCALYGGGGLGREKVVLDFYFCRSSVIQERINFLDNYLP